jgi:pyruvate carboxylase
MRVWQEGFRSTGGTDVYVVLCWVLLLQGVSTHIKLKAAGELQDSGKREVYFEANGVPRVVEVVDKKSTEVLGKAAIREKVRRGQAVGDSKSHGAKHSQPTVFLAAKRGFV